MKISIVVPIYNLKKYIGKCIYSICNQTYKSIEIILVDDGSTDGSSDIVDKYAKSDSRIIAIHEENQGESHARNVGLEHATGDYIAFVDCDDWIEPDMYETLLSEAVCNDLDIVAAGWYKETENEDGVWLNQPVTNEKSVIQSVFGRNELLRYLYERDSYRGFSYMWDKLYRRDVLLDGKGHLRKFNETFRLGGDVIYLAEAALNCNQAKYIDKSFYHYRIRKQSGSHTKDPEDFHQWVDSYEVIINRFKDEHISEDIIDYLRRFLAYHASQGIAIARENNNKDEEIFFREQMIKYQGVYEQLNSSHPEWIRQYKELLKT